MRRSCSASRRGCWETRMKLKMCCRKHLPRRFRCCARVRTAVIAPCRRGCTGVVTNAALDRLRSAKRAQAAHQRAETVSEEAASPSPEAAVALRELAQALDELPEDQRAALVLKEIHGLPTRDVAQVLERSEGAIE